MNASGSCGSADANRCRRRRRTSPTKRSCTERSTRIRLRAQQSCPALSNTEPGTRRRGGFEVGVGEHDVGTLAAELECHPLQRVGRAPHDVLADRRRPGEADLGDVGMIDQPLAGRRPVTDNDVEDAFGDARPRAPARRAGGSSSGVSSLGLSTTVLPHANAGPSFHDAISIGKFHGVISPTTPSGSCNVIASPSPHGCGTGVLVDRSRVVVQHVGDRVGLPQRTADRLAHVRGLELRPARRRGRRQCRRSAGATASDPGCSLPPSPEMPARPPRRRGRPRPREPVRV